MQSIPVQQSPVNLATHMSFKRPLKFVELSDYMTAWTLTLPCSLGF